MPPTGIYSGQFLGTHSAGPTGGDADSLLFYSMGEDPMIIRQQQLLDQQQQPLQQENPQAEGFRKIELALNTAVNPPALVRRVQRTLEPSADTRVEEEIICRDVRSFSLRYFDGTNWQEDWDSTVLGDVLPLSVALTIELNDPSNPPPARSTRRVTRIIPMACGRELDLATAAAGGAP